MELEHLESSFP